MAGKKDHKEYVRTEHGKVQHVKGTARLNAIFKQQAHQLAGPRRAGAPQNHDPQGSNQPGSEGQGIKWDKNRKWTMSTTEQVNNWDPNTDVAEDLFYKHNVMSADVYPKIAAHYRRLINLGVPHDDAAAATASAFEDQVQGLSPKKSKVELSSAPTQPGSKKQNMIGSYNVYDAIRFSNETGQGVGEMKGPNSLGPVPEGIHLPTKLGAGDSLTGRITALPDGPEKDFLTSEIQNPNSPYYHAVGPGASSAGRATRLKLVQYFQLRDMGYDPEHVHAEVSTRKQGGTGLKTNPYAPKRKVRKTDNPLLTPKEKAYKSIQDKKRNNSMGITPTKRYKTGGPTHSEMKLNVRIPGADLPDKISKENPDWSQFQVLQYREHQKDAITQDALEQNARWSHETRTASLLGKDPTGGPAHGYPNNERSNQVTFFTTSLGKPAISVSANSLLGQYVIGKRKDMLKKQGESRYKLKGEFPEAVRDKHIMEASTGLTLGAEGRYGVYKTTGWRRGNKSSKGYGKQLPIGSQILRDSTGQPIYHNGNVVYTEGYTRPFDVSTNRDVGMRLFLG